MKKDHQAGVLPITLLSAMALTTGVQAEQRPNIFFAFGDDLGRYANIYHQLEKKEDVNSIISTPNIDRIANEGVTFINAHVCAPSSTPCRSALLSGQYFWRTERGAILQGATWDSSIPSFPLILKENGYHIGRTYKVWYPGTPANAPFGANDNTFEKHGTDFCRFSQTVLSKTTANEIEAEKNRLFSEVINNFQDFIDARPNDNTPFYYWWGPWNTHREWEKGSGKKLWNINPDDLKGKMPKSLPDVAEIREDFADYLGEVLAFDYALGLILNKLTEMGELDNTVVIVSGDHGIPGFPRAKCNLYNFGTHVPLVARYPAMIGAGRVVDDFVNLMDLAPTFLELGGVTPPDVMTGRSIVPLLASSKSGQLEDKRTFVVTGFERHVAAAREGNLPYPSRAITTKEYKYIRNFAPERWPIGHKSNGYQDLDGGPTKSWFLQNICNEAYAQEVALGFGKRPYEELYDLTNDPDELVNVANIPTYAAIKQILSDQLEHILIENDDPRMSNDVCIFERYPYTIPNP